MKKWFYVEEGQQKGPFVFEQLQLEGLKHDTLVWTEGYEEWVRAIEIPELSGYIKKNLPKTPPPLKLAIETQGIKKEESFAPDSEEEIINKILREAATANAITPGLHKNNQNNNSMFKKPFSFKGRIRRTEFGITVIIGAIISFLLQWYASIGEAAAVMALLLYVPLIWFMCAQGAKRCHDRNNTGWFQVIPYYFIWMLFAKGDSRTNSYGLDPKKAS